jgi:TPR repeat protein
MMKKKRGIANICCFIFLSGCTLNQNQISQPISSDNATHHEKNNQPNNHLNPINTSLIHADKTPIKFGQSLSKLDSIIAKLETNNLTENEINTEIAALTTLAQENLEARLYLALMYEEGRLISQDFFKARSLYKKAADENDAAGIYFYSLMLVEGRGGEADLNRAETLLTKNYYNQHTPSIHALAYLYALQKKPQAVIALLEDKALNLTPESRYSLAISYLQTNQKHPLAIKMLKQAASEKMPMAYHALGKIYFHGLHQQEKDNKKSLYYLQKAAELNVSAGLYDFAMLIQANPTLVDSPKVTLLRALEQADKLGNKDASFEIAKLYDIGHLLKKDHKKAYLWYKKSAERGNNRAMYNLASMYSTGEGVTPSLSDAKYWLEQSASHGNERAKAILNN